jgi:hypothetical protein
VGSDPVQMNDGVTVVVRGDLITILYGADARLHRTRWLFDRIDEAIAARAGPILAHMIVLEKSGPPDGPTRAENATRMKKVGASLRKLVTTPLGDGMQVSIVRTVMRGIVILQGQRSVHLITNTIEEGIARVLESASAETPKRSQIIADFRAQYRALGRTPPDFDAGVKNASV